MGILNKDLKRAYRWLSGGKYSKVIRFLEPKVPLFLDDPDYYAILGRACLEIGMLKNAETYLNRGLQASPAHLDIRLNLAVCYIKKKNSPSAIRTWLEILDDYPGNKHAARGLKTMKKTRTTSDQEMFFNKFQSWHYLPSIRMKWPGKIIIVSVALVLVLLLISIEREFLEWPLFAGNSIEQRQGIEYFSQISQKNTAIESDDIHQLSEEVVAALLKKAQGYFENYEDNRTRFELNKIRSANVSEKIYQQVEAILASLSEPTLETLETAYTIQEVAGNPRNYMGCWVLWRGVTANMEFMTNSINFDFLVGYEDGEVLDGRVPVTVPFLTVMEPLPLEVLGRIELVEDSFRLIGKTLYFLR